MKIFFLIQLKNELILCRNSYFYPNCYFFQFTKKILETLKGNSSTKKHFSKNLNKEFLVGQTTKDIRKLENLKDYLFRRAV